MRPKKTYASQLTIKDQQVTDYDHYLSRRDFIQSGIVAGAGLLGMAYTGSLAAESAAARSTATKAHKSANVKSGGMSQWFDVDEKLSSYKSITTYNNFYEFGTDKSDPAKHAHKLTTQPWTVEVMGECEKPGKVALEQLFKAAWLEERTYRFRCVEGWSMVIPWQGVQLSKVLAPFKPTSKAKYVVFETLYRPKEMFKQNTSIMEWPYVEGLRMDEAMHPLTMLATGIYGKDLLNQNGAPLRLVAPWKYGFKGIKSIVKIAFVEQQPINSWQKANRHEYGFYSNVNPQVPHPRWSQAKERRIGELFKRDTLMFNGYADAVADLYSGMDLKKHI